MKPKKPNTIDPPTASTIPVHCSYLRLADVTTLVANPRNPNKHSDKQVALLAKVIQHQGWRSPITISKRSGFVVTGHGRLAAALLLQVEVVPIDEQEFTTEADEWAHLVADNRLAELADADRTMIAELLGELTAGGLDMDLTGFDMDALDELMTTEESTTEDLYTNKIVAPIYEPKGEKPAIADMIDRSKTDELMKQIKEADIPNEVAEFLRFAAERHTKFHFRNIAEFYCHADKPTQDLMEKSALIIIDFNKAIENGFVHLTERLGALANMEEAENEG